MGFDHYCSSWEREEKAETSSSEIEGGSKLASDPEGSRLRSGGVGRRSAQRARQRKLRAEEARRNHAFRSGVAHGAHHSTSSSVRQSACESAAGVLDRAGLDTLLACLMVFLDEYFQKSQPMAEMVRQAVKQTIDEQFSFAMVSMAPVAPMATAGPTMTSQPSMASVAPMTTAGPTMTSQTASTPPVTPPTSSALPVIKIRHDNSWRSDTYDTVANEAEWMPLNKFPFLATPGISDNEEAANFCKQDYSAPVFERASVIDLENMAPFSLQPDPKHRAAAKIQAAFKGYSFRNGIVFGTIAMWMEFSRNERRRIQGAEEADTLDLT